MYSFQSLGRAHGEPFVSGRLKQFNQDFVVEERMPIEPSGHGEHLWLQLRKSGCNTDWLARQLAQVAGVKPISVSYAGLKDRHAETTQWFSIHLPGMADPDLSPLLSEQVQLLQQHRHDRKLKRGVLAGNHFRLRVRDLQGDQKILSERLRTVSERGVPNYFGEQRFGHEMNNLRQADALFSGSLRRVKRQQKSLYLSAARSWIFNQVLNRRVRQENWDQFLAGDVFQLDGKSACFNDDASSDLVARLNAKHIHPTGPLWGRGELMSRDLCAELECSVAEQFGTFCEGLERAGMKQERRSLRLLVKELAWRFDEQGLVLEFDLPAGAYATMVLREVIELRDD